MKKYTIQRKSFTPTQLKQHAKSILRSSEEAWKKDVFRFIDEWLNDENSIQVQSSGSTGKPKSFNVEKWKCKQSAEMTARKFGLHAGANALLCLSPTTIAGKMMIIRAFENQWNLLLTKPDGLPVLPVDAQIDFAAMVPYQVQRLLQEKPDDLTRIRTLILGGARLQSSLEESLQDTTCQVYETFGMTETLTHVAVRGVNGPFRSEWFQTVPGVSVGIDRKSCLMIDAAWAIKSPLHTHDMVEMKPPDRFRWLGRIDNIINSGGIKVHPETIERKLESRIGTHPYFVGGVPDSSLGEKVVLFVENREKIIFDRDWLFDGFHPYEKPRDIIVLSSFERTRTGKINRVKTIRKSGAL